jgi:hypothetical protein
MNKNGAHLKRFAIFFFLAFLDERLAAEISDRAAASYKSKNPKSLDPNSPEMRRLTIDLCKTYWETNKRRISRRDVKPNLEAFGKLPAQVSLQPWIRFHKNTSDEEILAFLLAQILKFSEQEVAEGLKISIGTLRHRISRAIRAIGSYAEGAQASG